MQGRPVIMAIGIAVASIVVPLSGATLSGAFAQEPPLRTGQLRLPNLAGSKSIAVPRLPLSRRSVGILIGLGGAALLSKSFENADKAARALDGGSFEGLIDMGDRYGDGIILGAAAMGFLAVGNMSGDQRLSATGRDLSRSLLMTWGTVWALKLAINAERLNGGNYSFPSGHTATAFAAAPVLAKHWGWKVGVPAYVLAVGTGLGRMEERRHYLSDVLFGAAIGFVMGREIVSFGGEDADDGVSISPGGVSVVVRF